ncbi:MAG: hypothetical protein NT091_00170, partial [Candidatus Falkowbacteria bacterium]|nr:hypothetical protein [Candidatus Falkowbacteria bacterium]
MHKTIKIIINKFLLWSDRILSVFFIAILIFTPITPTLAAIASDPSPSSALSNYSGTLSLKATKASDFSYSLQLSQGAKDVEI